MIQIDKNYIIDVDKHCYTVKIDKHREDKNGNPVYDVWGYYSSLENAIKGVIDAMNTAKLKRGTHDLEKALQIVQKTNDQFTKLLKKAVKLDD